MITSSSNPKVKQVVQWQEKAKERRSAGVFLAEGFKMYEEAPTGDICQVYVSGQALEKAMAYPAVRRKLQETGYETVSEEVFRKISDTQAPQGLLCVVRQPRYSLEEMLQAACPLLVILENLQDPGNLGTILRTGEGAGVTGVILTGQTVDIFNPKVIRSTMGSIYRVPFVYVDDMAAAMEKLHKAGITAYAAHLQGEREYDSFSFREGTAFLIGNEGQGLSRELASLADTYLKIPMEGQVESLNAAVAASLLLYEAHRNRKGCLKG